MEQIEWRDKWWVLSCPESDVSFSMSREGKQEVVCRFSNFQVWKLKVTRSLAVYVDT